MMDYRKLRNEYIRRSLRYANGVSSLYDQAIAEIAREFALVDYNPDVVFSFDEYGRFGRVDSIMSRLESQIQQAVNIAIENEFGAAYKAHSNLLEQVLGTNVREELERAFAPRMTSGNAAKLYISETAANNITHSTRVWNGAVLGQMETAVQEALMDGMPAKQMAGLIEEYLNEPDSCFRRFRIKTGVDADGKSMYGRKWKKRIRNENGSTSWFDADPRDYPTGQGVYHSSYQNALRYTRTSTNIAYRTADYERYQTEDFVLGFEIHITGNPAHKEDICDMLQGRYPKDFKWTGWHPNCMCYQVPILATPEEVNAMADAILNDQDPASVPVAGRVTDVPDNFKDWVANNEDRIQDTLNRGKELPYFLRDNGMVNDKGLYSIKGFGPTTQLSEREILQRKYDELQGELNELFKTPQIKMGKDFNDKMNSLFYQLNEIKRQIDSLPDSINQANITTPDYFITSDSNKMSYVDRIKNVRDRLLWRYGTADKSIQPYIALLDDSIGSEKRAQSAFNAVKEKVKSILHPDTPEEHYLFNVYQHLNELKSADLSEIPRQWRATFMKLSRDISAFDLSANGVMGIHNEIEHAYNIYKLSTTESCIKYGLEKLSDKTPFNIFTDVAKHVKGIEKAIPKKEFWDNIDRFVPLITDNPEQNAYYSPVYRICNITSWDRMNESEWMRERVFYHEYGHAMGDVSRKGKWINNKDVMTIWSEIETDILSGNMNDQAEMLINLLHSNPSADRIEQATALSDVYMAAFRSDVWFNKVGGHSAKYFSSFDNRIDEFIAHCSENYWSGNQFAEVFNKGAYTKMIQLMKILLDV